MFPLAAEIADLTAWTLAQRGARNQRDPRIPYGFFVEEERSPSGEIVPVATILLTNRECPWKCVMCDLWKNTLTKPVGLGDIPAQIDFALAQLPPARHIKLYNSGSFFDRDAIPIEDYRAIASRLQPFERVIVESHPALVGKGTLLFRDALHGQLEVAMGLETAHPEVLRKLNKGMSLSLFSDVATSLRANGIDLRTFILVTPPFLPLSEALDWTRRSLDFAFDAGATAASLIPVRAGNGAMEILRQEDMFTPTPLAILEDALSCGIALGKGRVFSDLWDLPLPSTFCAACLDFRVARLKAMNLTQTLIPPVSCAFCGGAR